MSRKTVQRDIQFLRYSLKAPIEYDYDRKGYYYTEPFWSLPAIYLSEAELLQLLVTQRMAEQYKGTPLTRTLETLFQKIHSVLVDKVKIDPGFVKTRFSFYGHPTRPISEEIWLPIVKALRDNRAIRFLYKPPTWQKHHSREVEPIHLASIAEEWYLVARDLEDNEDKLKLFAISRIESIEKIIDETFDPPEFDPEAFFSNRFGRFIGTPGESHEIVVRFDKEAAIWIPERQWHPKQKIEKHADGSLTLSFPAPALYEVKRWVLQWGGDAEVIQPGELRQEIQQEIEKMKAKYQG